MSEILFSASPAAAILVFCTAGLAMLGFGAIATSIFARSMPGRVVLTATEALEIAEVTAASQRALKVDFASTLEQLEHYVDQVERKRRSLQGAESRMRRDITEQERLNADQPTESADDKRARLRRQVYGDRRQPVGIRAGPNGPTS